MAGEPYITIVGNLTADPELRFTQSGKGVAKFNVAVNPRKKNNQTQQWEEATTMWFQVTAWGTLGENACESLSKGDRVHVTGRLSCEEWEAKDGSKRVTWQINADEISPSLLWSTARVQKASRGGGGATSDDPWTQATPANREPAKAAASWSDEPPF